VAVLADRGTWHHYACPTLSQGDDRAARRRGLNVGPQLLAEGDVARH
jgi:hypothetical protein